MGKEKAGAGIRLPERQGGNRWVKALKYIEVKGRKQNTRQSECAR